MTKPTPSTIIFETEIAGFPIMLLQNPDRTFCTRYGKEFHTSLDYSEAAKQLGLSIMHGLACEGKIED